MSLTKRPDCHTTISVIQMKARKLEFDPGRIVVNQNKKVRLEITGEDVTYGINTKLPPNDTVTVEFTADKLGSFHFGCSVYRV